MSLVLTPDQDISAKYLIDFVENKPTTNEDYFVTLEGFAGTGKTTVMNYVISEIKRKQKVVVSAPTHKAKEVIAEFTKQNADTIQSLLGLRPNTDLEDFTPNKLVFDVKAEERIQFYNVVIIDEASMLNKNIVELIEEKAIKYKTKVIYMGDIYQLPPIGEVISCVFNHKNKTTLTTIVRQKNTNPNQKLIELARNDVRDNTDTFYSYIKEVNSDINGEEGWKLLDKVEYYSLLLEKYYDSEYQQNPNIAKALCWTNKMVTSTNEFLRKHIIKSEELVAVGDILMGYRPISKELDTPPFFIPIVKNSVDYIVQKVTIEEITIVGVILKVYRVEVKDGEAVMNILHRDSYETFKYHYADRHTNGTLHRRWKPFYDFKNKIIVMEDISYGDSWKDVCPKDISYGYAITTHKSQGSTYSNVGINLADLFKNKTPQERRKLTYVAISRTSKVNLLLI